MYRSQTGRAKSFISLACSSGLPLVQLVGFRHHHQRRLRSNKSVGLLLTQISIIGSQVGGRWVSTIMDTFFKLFCGNFRLDPALDCCATQSGLSPVLAFQCKVVEVALHVDVLFWLSFSDLVRLRLRQLRLLGTCRSLHLAQIPVIAAATTAAVCLECCCILLLGCSFRCCGLLLPTSASIASSATRFTTEPPTDPYRVPSCELLYTLKCMARA